MENWIGSRINIVLYHFLKKVKNAGERPGCEEGNFLTPACRHLFDANTNVEYNRVGTHDAPVNFFI